MPASSRFAPTDAAVLDGGATRVETAVVVADGRIEAVCPEVSLPDGVERVALAGVRADMVWSDRADRVGATWIAGERAAGEGRTPNFRFSSFGFRFSSASLSF